MPALVQIASLLLHGGCVASTFHCCRHDFDVRLVTETQQVLQCVPCQRQCMGWRFEFHCKHQCDNALSETLQTDGQHSVKFSGQKSCQLSLFLSFSSLALAYMPLMTWLEEQNALLMMGC